MKRIVTVRNYAGREQEITIHEARSDEAACSKAIREAGKRQSGGPWYAVTVRTAGEIRA